MWAHSDRPNDSKSKCDTTTGTMPYHNQRSHTNQEMTDIVRSDRGED